jgi:hypothetical protein
MRGQYRHQVQQRTVPVQCCRAKSIGLVASRGRDATSLRVSIDLIRVAGDGFVVSMPPLKGLGY